MDVKQYHGQQSKGSFTANKMFSNEERRQPESYPTQPFPAHLETRSRQVDRLSKRQQLSPENAQLAQSGWGTLRGDDSFQQRAKVQ